MQNKILIILTVIVVVGIAILLVLLNGGSSAPNQQSSSQSQSATNPNFFVGSIATNSIPPGTYNGIGIYDHNCLPIGNGLYSCDAGIKTAQYGTIDFDYQHNMMIKPCIGPGDNVVITIYSNGTATVKRTTSNPNYS